ncbi:hypothetical protein PFISCL1PPCAC_17159, partial [Pristionchus fissidentatus]
DLHQTPSGFVSSLVIVSVSVLFPPSSFLIFIILLRLPPVHSAAQCFFSLLLFRLPPVRSAAQCFFSFPLFFDPGSVVGITGSIVGMQSSLLGFSSASCVSRVLSPCIWNVCVLPQQSLTALTVSLSFALRTLPSLIAWSSLSVC